MIYLLVRNSFGYDDSDCPLFAHHDVEVVEQVRDRLKDYYEKAREIAKCWLTDQEQIRKVPSSPDAFYQRINQLKEDYAKRQIPKSILNGAYFYNNHHTFSIQTIEDDPNVDMSSL
jgi:hypothetical protein